MNGVVAVTGADCATCTVCGRRVRLSPAGAVPPRCPDCGALLPWLTVAGDDEFDDALQCPWPVLVNFWSLGLTAPSIIEVTRQHAGRLKGVTVDVEQAPRSAATFGVTTVPSLYLVRNRLVLARRAGAAPVDRLLEWVEHTLSRG